MSWSRTRRRAPISRRPKPSSPPPPPSLIPSTSTCPLACRVAPLEKEISEDNLHDSPRPSRTRNFYGNCLVVFIGVLSLATTIDASYNNDQSFQSPRHTARCFSCMSRLYEAVWPSLAAIYKRPKNFTDSCDLDRLEGRGVPYSLCGTICIKMTEEPIVAGVRVRGHIRGCLDDVLINGFNQSIVSWWMHRDSCKKYRKRELFKLGAEMSDESSIEVCTCYADHCNGSGVSSHREAASKALGLLLLFLLVLSLP